MPKDLFLTTYVIKKDQIVGEMKKRLCNGRKFLRQKVVAIDEKQPFPSCLPENRIAHRTNSTIIWKMYDADKRGSFCIAVAKTARAITRGVVYDERFDFLRCMPQDTVKTGG